MSRRGCKQAQKPEHPAARRAFVLSQERHSASASPQEAAPHTGLVQPSQRTVCTNHLHGSGRCSAQAPPHHDHADARGAAGCLSQLLPFRLKRFEKVALLPCPAPRHSTSPWLLQWHRDTPKGAQLPKPVGCPSPTPSGLTWRQC